MQHIHTFGPNDAPLAQMVQRVLLVEGIATQLRNVNLSTALGEIPFTECFPELWVLEDTQAEAARTLLQEVLQPPPANGDSWLCPQCHTRIDSGLTVCWNCEAHRDRG